MSEKYKCISCEDECADYEYIPCYECREIEAYERELDEAFSEFYQSVL